MEKMACHIGQMAYRAMLEEVYTSPKPGLVDLYSTGAHQDMDVSTFEASAKALKPYFNVMALEGMRFSHTPGLLFEDIRRIGLEAEKAMFKATNGVNTHKGLLFHMGLLSSAAGVCLVTYGKITAEHLFEIEKDMVRETLLREVQKMQEFISHGEKNIQKYGTMGARGEAISGYGSIRKIALPILTRGIKEGREWNRIKLQTLLTLMSQAEDSNILARHDPFVLFEVQNMARDFLHRGGAYGGNSIGILKELDKTFTERRISAGGCADLLAVTIFVSELIKEPVKRRFLWNSWNGKEGHLREKNLSS